MLRLADDLGVVLDAGRAGTTRIVLEAVRDDVGLGDGDEPARPHRRRPGVEPPRRPRGPARRRRPAPRPGRASSRGCARRSSARRHPDGVTLSTIHRVKGREWDRVAVFGVADGIVPHRLAEDVEEERRVLHVGDHPRPPPRRRARRPHPPEPVPRRARRTAPHRPAPPPCAEERQRPADRRATRRRRRHRRGRGPRAHGAGRVQRHGRGRRRPVGARPPPVGQHAPRALRRARRARRPPGAAGRSRRSCGARRPRPRRRCGRGAPSGRGPTASRRTSSPTTSTCAASPSPGRDAGRADRLRRHRPGQARALRRRDPRRPRDPDLTCDLIGSRPSERPIGAGRSALRERQRTLDRRE